MSNAFLRCFANGRIDRVQFRTRNYRVKTVNIDDKYFSVNSQVTIRYENTTREGIVVTDEIGMPNYHSFRALAGLNAELQITIQGNDMFTRCDFHMGHAEGFE